MKTIENRENNNLLVELTSLNLANIIERQNRNASVVAVEEVAENDYKTSLAVYESFNTIIGGATLALIECLKTKENPQKVYHFNDDEYKFLLSVQ